MPYYTVVFDDSGQMMRGFESDGQGVKAPGASVVERTNRTSSDVLAAARQNELRSRGVRNISSVAIVTTENPHLCFWQGDKEICLGH